MGGHGPWRGRSLGLGRSRPGASGVMAHLLEGFRGSARAVTLGLAPLLLLLGHNVEGGPPSLARNDDLAKGRLPRVINNWGTELTHLLRSISRDQQQHNHDYSRPLDPAPSYSCGCSPCERSGPEQLTIRIGIINSTDASLIPTGIQRKVGSTQPQISPCSQHHSVRIQ